MMTPNTKKSTFRKLPTGYQPGRFDVLCGRGRKCFYHVGNEHFRDVVKSMIPDYTSASTKKEKGFILSMIVQSIRNKAGIGGFIKQDDNGNWYEVGNHLAREKVSQAFRDALSHKYKSSTAYKKLRREVEQRGELFDPQWETDGSSSSIGESKASSISTRESQTTNTAPSLESTKSLSLFDLLDRDLMRSFNRISQDVPRSYEAVKVPQYDTFAMEDLEPVPLPGPNPFALPQKPLHFSSLTVQQSRQIPLQRPWFLENSSQSFQN